MEGPESPSPESPELVPGLKNPRALSLERFPVRTREGSTTRSAWRLSVESGGGAGAIVFIEFAPEETFYRGEGVFLGWPPDRLAAAYAALLPKPEPDRFELPQLG